MRLITVLLFVLAAGGLAMAIEEPRYEVVRTYDAFELRRYAPMIVAETEVQGTFDDAGSAAFRSLFRYIQGNNRDTRKIAMTAPVTQEPSGVEIDMTAPVVQSPSGSAPGRFVIAFVMPASFTRETTPEPGDPRVRIREVPGRLVAARRYSGSWSEAKYRENESALLAAVAREGLSPLGPPTFARYNSPFALWFVRRNEVLVEVAERPESSSMPQ